LDLFSGLAFFVFGGCLVGGGSESGVATAASPATRDYKSLSGFGEVEKLLPGFPVVNDGSYRNGQFDGFAISSRSIAPFTVPASLRFVFGIESEMQQRVVVEAGNENHIAAVAAITAAWPAARHVFFATKRKATIAAVAGLYGNKNFVDKHLGDKRKGPVLVGQPSSSTGENVSFGR
jgi:hypothetical protein